MDVSVADLPHSGDSVALAALWTAAFPTVDPATIHFDLVGSDGFHPSSRPKCARLLSGAEVASGWMRVATHDVSYDDIMNLPGCYRVKAVVEMDGMR